MEAPAPVRKDSRRETWKRKFDYLLSIVGMMIGLGNVWRFPYLCYKNGGGAFLVPYLLFIVFAAWPVVVFETALGQFSGQSSLLCWGLVPLMKGIGYLTPVLLLLSNTSYPVILTWSLRWLLASFSREQPWISCNNTWNTERCIPIMTEDNETMESYVSTQSKFSNASDLRDSSTEEFWKYRILQLTSGIEEQGSMNWELLGCFAMIWILIYFAIWKGIGWTSKIIYVTATLPLVMILVVLVRGATLPGAQSGISFYLKPNATKLLQREVWIDAASQVLYSCGTCSGLLSSMSRYNKFEHNFLSDSIIFLFANACASFVSGFAIFSILGFLAEVKNSTIADVVESGPGLVFVAYPTALSLLPLPQLWSAIFFFTLILLGFDSQFVAQESLTGCIRDLSPRLYNKLGREKMIALTCLFTFLFGVSMMMQAGMFVFNIFDQYAVTGWCLFFIVTCECINIGWLYGADKMCDDIEYMLRYKIPRIWFKVCWKFVTPCMTLFAMIHSIVKYQPLKYNTYVYPISANIIGWIMALSSMTWIPGTAIYQLLKAEGRTFLQKFRSSIETPLKWRAVRKDVKTEKKEEEIQLNK